MSYQKFTADYIFTGYELLNSDTVLITDEAGNVQDLVLDFEAGDDIQRFSGLISPGFINSHCHLELSHLKNKIPEKTGLPYFVQNVMRIRAAESEEKTAAMQDAVKKMYESGIVAVGDICNTADSITVKKESSIQWHHFIEVSGFIDAVAGKRLAEMKKVYDAFIDAGFNMEQTSFSPHAPYSVSKSLFELINQETANRIITIHNQECIAENELYFNKTGNFLDLYKNLGINIEGFNATGRSSFQTWLPYFLKQQRIIAVHNTFTDKEDIGWYKENMKRDNLQPYFCLCANANAYIENAVPPVKMLQENECNIIVGTDSYASNHQLNILEEIKTLQKWNSSISLKEMLKWATINGAQALNMEEKLGSFEKGKKPGIVMINHLNVDTITSQSVAKRLL